MKILNFGSLNIDYVYSVEHFVRPGETISSLELNKYCGGKGLNQSIALARAGAQVYHAGCIGKDGQMLFECLKENNVNTEYISFVACSSGQAIIQVDKSGQNCIILYGGANQVITEEQVDIVIKDFSNGDILLLQNEINCIEYLIKKAYKKGMQIAINPSPVNSNIKKLPFELIKYFILNEIEGAEITGENETEKIVAKLLEKYPNSCVVLTLGKKGVIYRDKEQAETNGIYNVKVIDTTAAGDTFTGYFLAGIVEGLPIKTVLERASIASSISVSRIGASDSIPYRKEVDEIKLEYIKLD